MTNERREYPRQPGSGLMARIGDKLVEVVDLSITGIKLTRSFSPVAGPMAFTLFRRNGSSLEINNTKAMKERLIMG